MFFSRIVTKMKNRERYRNAKVSWQKAKDKVMELTFIIPNKVFSMWGEEEQINALKLFRQWEQLSYEISDKQMELTAVDSMLRNKFFVVPESTKNYSVTEWEDTLRKRQNMDNWHLQKYRGVDTGYEFK